jgi:RNA polymerase sigma-70 factor (ECF subfamily)
MTTEQFEDVIERYQATIISVIQKMVHSWDIACDLAQDSFVRLWNFRQKINPKQSIFTLMYKIAMNVSIDHLRKQKPTSSDFDLIESTPLDATIECKELHEIIQRCMNMLKPKQKAAFILRDMEGLTFDEISNILNMSVSNVRSNLHLARRNIRDLMQSRYNLILEDIHEL